MTDQADLTASRLYVARAFIAIIGSALFVWWLAPGSPQMTMAAGLAASALVAYGFIQWADNGSVFDAWWSVIPAVAALWAVFGVATNDALTARQVAVLSVTLFWGVRLTLNWWRDWPGLHHEDWRFRQLAESWPLPTWAVRLIAVVVVQCLFVIGGLLPLHPALVEGNTGFALLGGAAPFNWLDAVALTVGIGATSIELVADEQMKIFAATKKPDDLMDKGLWRLSRHPNYFGEIGFWFSLWLFAVAAVPSAWWTGIGVVIIYAMFRGVSIPMLDERSTERRPQYAEYAARTPALIPWPRRREGGAS